MKFLIMYFFQPSVAASLKGPNTFFSTIFSDTLRPCFPLTVRDQVSHPGNTVGKVVAPCSYTRDSTIHSDRDVLTVQSTAQFRREHTHAAEFGQICTGTQTVHGSETFWTHLYWDSNSTWLTDGCSCRMVTTVRSFPTDNRYFIGDLLTLQINRLYGIWNYLLVLH
jgi:hypothetical protein